MNIKLKPISKNINKIYTQNVRITQLSKSGRIEEAVNLFNRMPRRNTVTYNSMISAYSKNGKLNDARNLFDKMPNRNLVSWNTMIAGYMHSNDANKASQLFDIMPERDEFTWTLMISCYTRIGELEKASFLFNLHPNNRDIACWNALIAGYAKNGRFCEARMIFDKMLKKDLVSWNSMLSGYTQNGEMSLGLEFFEGMGERDSVSWNLMVDGYLKLGELDSAWDLFQKIPNPGIVSYVTMLSGFGRNGKIDEARRLFDDMAHRDVVAWNAMISAYVQNKKIFEAITLFKEMPGKNAISWTTIIDGYVRAGELEEARKLLDQMPYRNIGAQTAMISGYVQSRKIAEAREIFNKVANGDTICWNAMIAGYAEYGDMGEALKLFKQMTHKDLFSWNTVIGGYAQAGEMEMAVGIFDEMRERNLVTWNILISGFNQNGLYTDALYYLSLLMNNGKKPDQSSFNIALSACANLAALQVGEELHQLVVKSGFETDLYVSNALICMYAKCGRIFCAKNVFTDIDCADIISWNSMITGYALNGFGEEAIKLFREMEIKMVKLDHITFIGVLSACSHSGLVEQGLSFFKSMIEEYNIEPLAEHYACIIGLLSRANRLEEAFGMVREMKIKPSAGIWGALLDACRMHKKIELAEFAAQKLSEFEPEKSSSYVLVSNMYAESGRWNEVDMVRGLVRERRIEKEKGCSWIENTNQLNVFLSDDKLLSQRPDISSTLKILTLQMKNFGSSLTICN